MSTNPDNKAQLTEMAKAIGAILGVPSVLFTIVNSVFEKPLISLTVALITAVIVSVWVILSRWISVREIITAWLALAVVVLAGFVIWPKTMTVEGFIYDTAHNPIGNEKVRLFDYSGKMYEVKTSAEGYYQFVDVPSGKYRVQVRTSEIEGETKGILVRVVQQNLTVSEITPIASPISVAVVTPDTPTAIPTLTNTLVPPTSTLTPTPAQINATVKVEALRLRGGPGTEYTIIITLRQGDGVVVIGQNPGGDWLKVEHEGQMGWVAKEYVEAPEKVSMVPIVEVPPTDTPTSTPSPSPTSTPTPTQMPLPTTPPTPAPTFIPMPTPLPSLTSTSTPTSTPTPTPSVVASRMIALQTYHKKEDKKRYVTAMGKDRDWVLRAETTERHEWEEFTLLDADTEEQLPCMGVFERLKRGEVIRIAFQTYHQRQNKNRLVTAMNYQAEEETGEIWDWVLRAETTELWGWERFTVIPLR